MSRLEELIQELCPNGVEYVPLWSVTIWDKKFNAVDRKKQPTVINYPYLLAADLFALEVADGDVFLLSTGEQTGWTTAELAGDNMREGEVVTIPWGKSRAVTDCIKYYNGRFVTADNRIMTSNDLSRLSNKYLYYWIMSKGKDVDTFYRGSGIKHPDMAKVLEMSIPVPPLPVQEEIVRILDSFTSLTAELQAELQARKKQYGYYRDELLHLDGENVTIHELFDMRNGFTPAKDNHDLWDDGTLPWFKLDDINDKGRVLSDSYLHITEKALKKSGLFPANSIIISTSATIGEYALITVPFLCNQRFTCLTVKPTFKNKVNVKYVMHYCPILSRYCKEHLNQGNFASVDMKQLVKFEFVLPPIEKQNYIVQTLDRFDALCNDISSGLPAEIEARQKQYEYYRDKLLSFKELGA